MKKIFPVLAGIITLLMLTACPNAPEPGEEKEITAFSFTAADNSALSSDVTGDISGTTANDFASPVTYTVTAEDGTTQDYAVTVTVAPRPAGDAVTHTADSVSFDMHYVPSGGPFTMGEHVEDSTKSVTLTKNFWMGRTEVTQGLWEDVWGTTWPGDDPDGSGYGAGAEYPAYYVNWFDVVAFCNLLTVADSSIANGEQVYYSDEGLNNVYTKTNADNSDDVFVDWTKTGYRLPTEAEWEYAARYIDGTSWNNGDHASGDTDYACYDPGSGPESGSPLASDERISEYAWWSENNSPNGTKEVGQKTANALGLRDMSGNVYERCYDRYATYSGDSEADPTGPGSGIERVYRGGSWSNSGYNLRCAYRNYSIPSIRPDNIGFRLCRTAD